MKAFKVFEVDTTAKDSDEDEMDDEAMDSTVGLDVNSIFSDSNSCKFRLPCHQRCAAHTLSLVASNDPLKLITVGSATDFKKIQRSTMAKCSSLWNKSSKPKAGEAIKEICGVQLVVPCVTRWNSLYDSVSCLMSPTVKPSLDKICDAVIIPKFKSAELEFLEEYQKVLAPIAHALDRLQGETFMGMLAPAIHSVKIKLMNWRKATRQNFAGHLSQDYLLRWKQDLKTSCHSIKQRKLKYLLQCRILSSNSNGFRLTSTRRSKIYF